jgi:hypothetical protein
VIDKVGKIVTHNGIRFEKGELPILAKLIMAPVCFVLTHDYRLESVSATKVTSSNGRVEKTETTKSVCFRCGRVRVHDIEWTESV